MLKSITDELIGIRCLALDLDGTLYPEIYFIRQAYEAVAEILTVSTNYNKEALRQIMIKMWLEWGSSKTDLFQEAFLRTGSNRPFTGELLQECLHAFRSCEFSLRLSDVWATFLDTVYEKGIPIFLITDGNNDLQRRKMRALGLEKWIPVGQVFVSGDYGAEYQKPSPFMGEELLKRFPEFKRDQVLYLGDRECDMKFAENCRFRFMRVNLKNE